MAILRVARLPLYPVALVREKLARGERRRELGGEPLVMDEPVGVEEYDAFGEGGEAGLHYFSARAISRLLPEGGMLLDLGCGSARLLARLARSRPDVRIVGLDLSEPMLETGRRNLEREGLAGRVELRRGDITAFDAEVTDDVDVVSCNFALHHLPDDDVAGRCLAAIGRAREKTGCGVWIFDFARLRHPGTWPLVTSMVDFPGPVVRNDAIASERAAFTAAELTALLERAGLGDLEHATSKPLGENQAHWALGAGRTPAAGLWRDAPLPSDARLLARVAMWSFPRALTRT